MVGTGHAHTHQKAWQSGSGLSFDPLSREWVDFGRFSGGDVGKKLRLPPADDLSQCATAPFRNRGSQRGSREFGNDDGDALATRREI